MAKRDCRAAQLCMERLKLDLLAHLFGTITAVIHLNQRNVNIRLIEPAIEWLSA
jgi:hypothetical protein